MAKETQKAKVLEIVKQAGSLRTEEVKRIAMFRGVSCPDRFLRWLAKEDPPKVKGEKKEGDRTKTWYVCEVEKTEPKETYTESVLRHHREQIGHCAKCAKKFAESPQSSIFNTDYLKGSL